MADEEKRRRKLSKNKKKNWRKHTDVAEIEEHLEDKRKDERTGGVTELKTNESLFFVDKKKEQAKKKRKEKKTEDNDEDEEIYVSQKELSKKRLQKEKEEELRQAKATRNRKVNTIWGQEVIAVTNDYLEPTVKKAKVKPFTVGTGKLEIGAVSTPDPGASYNPDFDSHQELLGKAHNAEVKKLKEFQKLNEKVKMVSVGELKKQSELWLQEMSQGIGGKDENSSDESSSGEDEEEYKSSGGKAKKTMQQRRKAKLKKLKEREKLEEKLLKQRLNEVFRIRKIKNEIKETELEKAERQKKKTELIKGIEKVRVKRLGKHKYRDDDITVQLSEDLCGTFRELKPEGNLITDRFKSLQRRNIIETRRPVVPHRKYKRKVFSKRSYRVPTIKEFGDSNKKT